MTDKRNKSVIVAVLGVVVALFSLYFALWFSVPYHKVALSVGFYGSKAFYTQGEFQDYTDYAKYEYKNPKPERSRYLQKIDDESKNELLSCIGDFEGWVSAYGSLGPDSELYQNYDFDAVIISDDDYVYIETDEDEFTCYSYDAYLFDVQSKTLYYFHNNI